jgi:hypothetical protein
MVPLVQEASKISLPIHPELPDFSATSPTLVLQLVSSQL